LKHLEEDIPLPYARVLAQWNETNEKVIEQLVFLMCDTHMELSQPGSIYSGCVDQLFPYEILAWLALRQQHGLENPEIFEHPLMNTPMVEYFLKLNAVLPDAKGPPFIQSLLNKVFGQVSF
jgi:hypothetical protein